MQCTCGTGHCHPCGMIKGVFLLVWGALYWLQVINLRVFLSVLVLLAGLKCLLAGKGKKVTASPGAVKNAAKKKRKK